MGHWNDEPETGGGTFAGRWAAFNICAETDSLPEVEFEEGDFGGFDTSDEVLDIEEPADPPGPPAPPVQDEPDVRHAPAPPCIDPDLPFGFLRGWHAPHPPGEDSPPEPDGLEPPMGVGPPDGIRPGPRPDIDGQGPRPDGMEHGPRPPGDPEPPDVHAGGVFHGRWWEHEGEVVGIVMGRYEPLGPIPLDEEPLDEEPFDERAVEDGDAPAPPPPHARVLGVFYGKYVDRSGRFRGFIRGVYGRGFHGVGVFRGRYYDDSGQERGVLRGRWDKHPFRPGGPFFGMWNGEELENANVPVEE